MPQRIHEASPKTDALSTELQPRLRGAVRLDLSLPRVWDHCWAHVPPDWAFARFPEKPTPMSVAARLPAADGLAPALAAGTGEGRGAGLSDAGYSADAFQAASKKACSSSTARW